MPKYKPQLMAKFKRDVWLLEKRGYDLSLLWDVVTILSDGKPLPPECRDHPLKGDRLGYRDCHVRGDWVLIYKINKNVLTLILSETGTHSDILE